MGVKAKREQYVVFMNVDTKEKPEWQAIGKDNEDASRSLNNEVNSKKNILGVTTVEVTKGNQTTSIDPYKQEADDKISEVLHDIYFNDLELSDVEKEFLEVSLYKKTEDGKYEAFKQTGAIDLKSHGGDTTGISDPFDINWLGERTYGTFDVDTKTFTPTTA